MTKPLPYFHLVTPEPADYASLDLFLLHLSEALAAGVRLVQLRSKRLSERSFQEIACQVNNRCCTVNATLLLNGPGNRNQESPLKNLHLTSAQLMACTKRPISSTWLLSAACHNEQELTHAAAIGVDFVTLSPVLPTLTQPRPAPLGWAHFSQLCASVDLPVFALGGLAPDDLELARKRGAHGIAAIRGLWPAAID